MSALGGPRIMGTINMPPNKALVVYAIERTLLEMGESTLDEIKELLSKEYHCGISECYEHPEYLKSVLGDIFGKSSVVITELIKKRLADSASRQPVIEFLRAIEA